MPDESLKALKSKDQEDGVQALLLQGMFFQATVLISPEYEATEGSNGAYPRSGVYEETTDAKQQALKTRFV